MRNTIICLFFSLVTFNFSQAQNINKALADNYFKNFAYTKAINLYEKALKKDSTNIEVLQRLAQSYKHVGNFNKAEEVFDLLKNKNDATTMSEYANLLIFNNRYAKADSIIEKFNLSLPNYLKQIKDSLLIRRPDFNIQLSDINSEYSDFRPCFYRNNLIFTSARDKSKKEYQWNGQPFLSLYEAKIYAGGKLKYAKPFSLMDSRLHISTFHYVKRQGLAYFTMNNANDITTSKGVNSEVNLSIYVAKRERGVWQKPIQVEKISSIDYSSAHPFYSTHDNRLYYSSNRPGGYGGTDIYYVTITNQGVSDPVNCGKDVNTAGNEMYPHVTPTGELYFSSNGHPGLGGLDLFCAKIINGKFGEVENLGVPINSARDDFSLTFREDQTFGYFSSNRKGGKGDDDIYLVTKIIHPTIVEKKEVAPQLAIAEKKDTVSNITESTKPIALNKPNKPKQPVKNIVPVAKKVLPPNKGMLTIESVSKILDQTKIESGTTIKTEQKKNLKFSFKNINYDFNSWDITPQAAFELNKLIALMKKHTSIKVQLSSHTDSRGNNAYNTVLSQARADAALKYILKHEISIHRIESIGYGEQRLLNSCKDGVNCSEELHRDNRRLEVLITNFGTK